MRRLLAESLILVLLVAVLAFQASLTQPLSNVSASHGMQVSFDMKPYPSLTVQKGQSAAYSFDAELLDGHPEQLTLRVSHTLPYGARVEFPNGNTEFTASPSFSTTITVTTSSTTPTGVYTVSVEVVGWTIMEREMVVVEEQFDFTLSASPDSVTLRPGFTGWWGPSITVSLVSGSPQPVSLRIDLASGPAKNPPKAIFRDSGTNIIQGTPPFFPTVRISVFADTSPGTYEYRVVGEGGGVTKEITLTMVVQETSSFDFSLSADELADITRPPVGGWYAPLITVSLVSGSPQPVTLRVELVSGGAVKNPPQPEFQPFASGQSPGTNIQGIPTFFVALQISVPIETPAGPYIFRVVGEGGGVTRELTLRLVVEGETTSTPTPTPSPTPTPPTTGTAQAGGKYTSLTYNVELTLDIVGSELAPGYQNTPGGPLGIMASGKFRYSVTAHSSFTITLEKESRFRDDLSAGDRALVTWEGSFTNEAYGCQPSGSIRGTTAADWGLSFSGEDKQVRVSQSVPGASTSQTPAGPIECIPEMHFGEVWSALIDFEIPPLSVSGGSVALGDEVPFGPDYTGSFTLSLVSSTKEEPKPTVEEIPTETKIPAVVEVIPPPPSRFDYEVLVFPQSLTIMQGDEAVYAVSVEHVDGTPQTVTLKLTTDPRISPTFSTGYARPSFDSKLTINTSCNTPPTLYAPQIIGESAEYRLSKQDVVTLLINPNPECATTNGPVTNTGTGWTTDRGFVDQPLGDRGKVIIGPKSEMRWFTTDEGIGFQLIKGKMHFGWTAESALPPPTVYIIPPGEITSGGRPIGGVGITISGTEFLVEVANDGTGTIAVLEGVVEVWKVQQPEKTVLVSEGQELVTHPDSPLSEPVAAYVEGSVDRYIPPLSTSISELPFLEGTWWQEPPKTAHSTSAIAGIFDTALVGILAIIAVVVAVAGALVIRKRKSKSAQFAPKVA